MDDIEKVSAVGSSARDSAGRRVFQCRNKTQQPLLPLLWAARHAQAATLKVLLITSVIANVVLVGATAAAP